MGFLPKALKLYMHRPEIAETLWMLNSNIMRDPSMVLNRFRESVHFRVRLLSLAIGTAGGFACQRS